MAVKSSGIFNIIIIMIDIEIKPPPDLNDTYMCYYIYWDYYECDWQKSFDTNIGPIQYLEKSGTYHSTFDNGIKSKEIIISYEKM